MIVSCKATVLNTKLNAWSFADKDGNEVQLHKLTLLDDGGYPVYVQTTKKEIIEKVKKGDSVSCSFILKGYNNKDGYKISLVECEVLHD